mmetsp:Transcript_38118/g.110026  ORF Transcript_38118/g.110026 Transcript_38118/m.110026 type:complete len:217 (-) Transcript_38118:279-929(-)
MPRVHRLHGPLRSAGLHQRQHPERHPHRTAGVGGPPGARPGRGPGPEAGGGLPGAGGVDAGGGGAAHAPRGLRQREGRRPDPEQGDRVPRARARALPEHALRGDVRHAGHRPRRGWPADRVRLRAEPAAESAERPASPDLPGLRGGRAAHELAGGPGRPHHGHDRLLRAPQHGRLRPPQPLRVLRLRLRRPTPVGAHRGPLVSGEHGLVHVQANGQ